VVLPGAVVAGITCPKAAADANMAIAAMFNVIFFMISRYLMNELVSIYIHK
jgi:hypothetical protein